MAGASDKARFYLEQYVPELQEYAQRSIFTASEISAIIAKRNGFEHNLSARSSRPSDYAQYIAYEINLRRLRRKRCERRKIRSTKFNDKVIILSILDRATKKFPGDTALWLQYIEFCRKEHATKRLVHVLTRALRIKPREHRLWILAAKHFADDLEDLSTARSYLQRGLRFCKDVLELWLEYARFEVMYMARISVRHNIQSVDDRNSLVETQTDADTSQISMMAVPNPPADDVQAVHLELEKVSASKPAFAGAIPIAIFDAAMIAFADRPDVAGSFFSMVVEFPCTQSTRAIMEHILTYLRSRAPQSVELTICSCHMELFGKDIDSPHFANALAVVIERLSAALALAECPSRHVLVEKTIALLLPLMEKSGRTDERLALVIKTLADRYHQIAQTTTQNLRDPSPIVKAFKNTD